VKGGGFVEEEGDAVEFAFAGAAGEGETNGMEEIAATEATGFLQMGDDFLEAFGGEGSGLEKEQSEMADDVTGRVARKSGVGVGGLQDLRGVVFEDEAEKMGEAGGIFGEVAEELRGAIGPGDLFGSGIGGEPVIFAEDLEDVGGGVRIDVDGMFGEVVVGGHGESLAQEKPPPHGRKGLVSASDGDDSNPATVPSLRSGKRRRFSGRDDRVRKTPAADGGQYKGEPLRREGGDDVGGDGFAPADGVYAFVGFGLEVDFFGGNAQRFGEGFAHFGEMRAEFGAFEDDDGVHVFDGEMLLVEKFAGMLEKLQAVGALPLGVGVRKMRADVAKARGAEQRVAERVGDHIAVGVAYRPFIEGDFDPADDELAAFREAMEIVADAAADAHARFLKPTK